MTTRGPAIALGLVLVLAGCGGDEPEAEDGAPAPEAVASCVEDRGVEVHASRYAPSFGARDELVAGRSEGRDVRILFYADEGGASGASNTLRIAGEPSIRVGQVIVIPAGPGFEDVEEAVLACVE